MIGLKFGRLFVLEETEPYISPSGKSKERCVLCNCDCGTKNIRVVARQLRDGTTKSCGCLRKEVSAKTGKKSKKYNKYDLSGEYGIGYTFNGDEFWFDIEDYDKIKQFCWRLDSKGRVITYDGKRIVQLHRLIMGIKDKAVQVDHIKHRPLDNRKAMLRIVDNSKNKMNSKLYKNNTSNFSGVCYDKSIGKWIAYITKNKKNFYLGSFNIKEDAIKARKDAEEKYFGEYSYYNSINN